MTITAVPPMSLWPNDFQSPPIRTPVGILREQADALGRLTANLLEGEIRTGHNEANSSQIVHRFFITAPVLDNFKHFLFSVTHGVANPYPVRLFPAPHGREDAPDEQTFVELLKEKLRSHETQAIINSLLAQCRG